MEGTCILIAIIAIIVYMYLDVVSEPLLNKASAATWSVSIFPKWYCMVAMGSTLCIVASFSTS